MVEYHRDYFDANPLEVHRGDDGFVKFTNTGDPLIDEWEEKIAAGEVVDLTEAFTEEQFDSITRRLAAAKGKKIQKAYQNAGYDIQSTIDRVKRQSEEQARQRQLSGTFY